jgi:hypothetical protein
MQQKSLTNSKMINSNFDTCSIFPGVEYVFLSFVLYVYVLWDEFLKRTFRPIFLYLSKFWYYSSLLFKQSFWSLRKHQKGGNLEAKLWIEETNELDVFETEISWNLKGLVAIAIATPVRKKSLAAAAPAIWFSETPPRRERDLDRCSRFATPPILP